MNLKVYYLGKIEVIFKMALGNESGDQVGLIHEKTEVKNLVRLSVPDHDGGRPMEVNACILITHMVYL